MTGLEKFEKEAWFSSICLRLAWLFLLKSRDLSGQDNLTRYFSGFRFPASSVCILYTKIEIQVREQGIIARGLWAFNPQGSICFFFPPKVSLCQTILIKEMTRTF